MSKNVTSIIVDYMLKVSGHKNKSVFAEEWARISATYISKWIKRGYIPDEYVDRFNADFPNANIPKEVVQKELNNRTDIVSFEDINIDEVTKNITQSLGLQAEMMLLNKEAVSLQLGNMIKMFVMLDKEDQIKIYKEIRDKHEEKSNFDFLEQSDIEALGEDVG